jgi:uncharacterized repeat protein (TIGR03803 family)
MSRLFSVLAKPIVSGCLAFSLAAGGAPAAQAASERVVYAFESKQPDGANPWGALINFAGSLYGTTYFAGEGGPIGKCAGTWGCGTVFELSPPVVAGGPWTESLLYVFKGGSDGANPMGGMINFEATLYGTTHNGGAHDAGTVFALTPPTIAGGSWTKSLVYSFTGGSDGANPTGGLINFEATLYGTTRSGGGNDAGTVFALAPPAVAGGSWTKSLVYSFNGSSDGANPTSGLINFEATLYGTTSSGGAKDAGTVFALTPPTIAGGSWTKSLVYSFAGGSDGAKPHGSLINLGATLYGTTRNGGANDAGTVFALTPPTIAGGSWTKSLVYAFSGGSDGTNPRGGVINVGGKLYGTTARGGDYRGGTVFQLDPPAIPGALWTHSVLHDFTGLSDGVDGAYPDASLINFEATLFGPTYRGGNFGCAGHGCGTVFAVTLP